jgi:Flp pilus assembly protein TadG
MSTITELRHWILNDEGGTVTIMTAVLMVGLVLVMGLSIDVSRIYLMRASLQNAADAASLAAARELNSGTTGLTAAVTRAQEIVNEYGLSRTTLTAPTATITTVEFATSLTEPVTWYLGAEGVPAGTESQVRFVRVTTQPVSITMLLAVKTLGNTHSVQRSATAGMSAGLNTVCDYVPLAVAKPTPTTPFATGTELQLQFRDQLSTSLSNKDLIVLQTGLPNGANQTRDAVAGINPICTTIGATVNTSNSNSANTNNGPYQVEDGLNTRLNDYPPGNVLPPSQAHPDTNVYEDPLFANFNSINYRNGDPFQSPTGNTLYEESGRRLIVMPIVDIGAISGSVVVKSFGVFLLLRKVVNPTQPSQCNDIPNPCGHVFVEYIGLPSTIGRGFFDPDADCTSLTKAVLYQ